MLTMNTTVPSRKPSLRRPPSRRHERGVILIIALVVLIAMMLGALTMIRATDGATLIAGNFAFKQSTITSADSGSEAAAAWIFAQSSGALAASTKSQGYSALVKSPTASQTWDEFFKLIPTDEKCAVSWSTDKPPVPSCSESPTEDYAGNTVTYVIHRLCAKEGDPTSAASGCATSPYDEDANTGNSKGVGAFAPTTTGTATYYRITVRTVGPRNTVSYTQTVISR